MSTLKTKILGLNKGVAGESFSTSDYNANWDTLDAASIPLVTATRSSAAYTATLANFTLATGAKLLCKFATVNTASNTLNVNGTGAKALYHNGSAVAAGAIAVNSLYLLQYDGTYWVISGYIPSAAQLDVLQSGITSAKLSELNAKVSFPEAPNDGKQYARKSGAWAEIVASGTNIPYYPNASNINVDNIWNTGLYECYGAAAGALPSGVSSSFILLALNVGTDTICQRIYCPGLKKEYVRWSQGGSFSAWAEVGGGVSVKSFVVTGDNSNHVYMNVDVALQQNTDYYCKFTANNTADVRSDGYYIDVSGATSSSYSYLRDINGNSFSSGALTRDAIYRFRYNSGYMYIDTANPINSLSDSLLGFTEDYNSSLGHNANTGLGYKALANINSSATFNTAVGKQAGKNITSGYKNTFVGVGAGAGTSVSYGNTMVGTDAGCDVGSYGNTHVGWRDIVCNYRNSSIYNTTMLGRMISSNLPSYNEWTALGYRAAELIAGDAQVQIGGPGQTVYGSSAYTSRSDERDKADIADLDYNALEFINALTPRQYRWDYRDDYWEVISVEEWRDSALTIEEQSEWEQFLFDVVDGEEVFKFRRHCEKDGSEKRKRLHNGLIAQEVKAAADTLGFDFGGFQDHTVNGGKDVMSLAYEEFIAPLIGAVQTLSAQVQDLKTQLNQTQE